MFVGLFHVMQKMETIFCVRQHKMNVSVEKITQKNWFYSKEKQQIKMTFYNSSSTMRPKTLMEMLLAKKIEAASAGEGGSPSSKRHLFRTDSMDSVSSIGSCGSCTSSMLGEDVCRCDDCLLGIVDLYIAGPKERAILMKKVIKSFKL